MLIFRAWANYGNTGAVTEESLQNSGLGKSLYLLELKKNKRIVRFFGVHLFCLQLSLQNAQVIKQWWI